MKAFVTLGVVIFAILGQCEAKPSYHGGYKYSPPGRHKYIVERPIGDGRIQGESIFERPDGVKIKVHYFADEEIAPPRRVLYNEPVIAKHVVPPSPVLVAPSPADASVKVNNYGKEIGVPFIRNGGNDEPLVVNSAGGDVAAAAPSITAVVGPGGRANVRPVAVARTGGVGSRGYYRRAGVGGGDVAIAKPKINAIVGAGGAVDIAPVADARTGDQGSYATKIIKEVPAARYVVEKPAPPLPPPAYFVVKPTPPPRIVHPVVAAPAVQVVAPNPSYQYTYSYSAPDGKYPARDNSAYVNVRVNQ